MFEAVIGLGSDQGSRLAALDAASELLAATEGARILAGSRLYLSARVAGNNALLSGALRILWAGTNDALSERLGNIERALSGDERGTTAGALALELLWREGETDVVGCPRVDHPQLWWRPDALAPLLNVAPELEEDFELTLGWAGGPPPAMPWVHVGGTGVTATVYPDIPEAVAGAAAWRAMQIGMPEQRATLVRSWDPTPEDGDLSAALAQIDVARAEGFHVRGAVVLHAHGERWKGKLLGVKAAPDEVRIRPLSLRIAEPQPEDAGGVRLQRV